MIGAVVQARMGSSRLPGKVMRTVAGRPLLHYALDRLGHLTSADELVVATSVSRADDPIADLARAEGVAVFRGSEDDVLDRYRETAEQRGFDAVVRITADCPLVDPEITDRLVREFRAGGYDLAHTGPTLPEGLDSEVFSRECLETVWGAAKLPSDREHVTAYAYKHQDRFRIHTLDLEEDLSRIRVVVDEAVDLEVVSEIIEELHRPGEVFHLADIVRLSRDRPELFERNAHVVRNEGYAKSLQHDARGGA